MGFSCINLGEGDKKMRLEEYLILAYLYASLGKAKSRRHLALALWIAKNHLEKNDREMQELQSHSTKKRKYLYTNE